jgi:hypothetical protein
LGNASLQNDGWKKCQFTQFWGKMLIKNVINEIAVASSQNDGWEMLVQKMLSGKMLDYKMLGKA